MTSEEMREARFQASSYQAALERLRAGEIATVPAAAKFLQVAPDGKLWEVRDALWRAMFSGEKIGDWTELETLTAYVAAALSVLSDRL